MAVPEVIKQAGSVARSASSAASMATALHPAVRWGGIVAIVAGAAVAGFALPKAQPKAQPIAIDEAPVLAADKALADAIRAGDKTAARRLLALQFTFVDADGKDYHAQGSACRFQKRCRRSGKRRPGAQLRHRRHGHRAAQIGARCRRVFSRCLDQAEGCMAGAADAGGAARCRRATVAALPAPARRAPPTR